MAMEGINFSEVHEQGRKLIGYFYNLNNDLVDRLSAFGEELSPVWASGNAVTFGDNVINSKRELCNIINSAINKTADEIYKAIEIYREKFNVSYGVSTLQVMNMMVGGGDNPFKETVNGITGMNKTVVKEYEEQLKTDITTILDEFITNTSNVRISIYDTAEAQQEAFASSIDEMKKEINETIDNIISQINNGIDTEIDRVDLAKSQTVNTFND